MKLYTNNSILSAFTDKIASGHENVELLLKRASSGVGEAAIRYCSGVKRAVVLCGPGDNGAVGIGAAYWLIHYGITVRVFQFGDPATVSKECAEMAHRLSSLGGRVERKELEEIREYAGHCGVLVDALFGAERKDALTGELADVVALINSLDVPVVSADIPSGVNGDTGNILGCAVKADVTVAFLAPRPGHWILPGGLNTGSLVVTDVDIPQDSLSWDDSRISLVEKKDVILPLRARDANKTDFGRVYIFAGSIGYTGAPAFSSEAAVRSGAGLVFLGVPKSIYAIEALKIQEAMPFPLPCDPAGAMLGSAADVALKRMENADACLIGPGLSRTPEVTKFVTELIRKAKCPLILDADGINTVAEHIDILREAAFPPVLTPHDGEFARLGGDLSGGRLAAARSFAHDNGCILVLKGYHTIVAAPDGRVWINSTGNPGMAKGGSGDVLSGMIAALIAQGLPAEEAAYKSVWLHGLAGDIAAEEKGEYSLTPCDLINYLSESFKAVMR